MIALSMAAGLSISAIQTLAAASAVNDDAAKMNTALKGAVCSPVGGLWLCHAADDQDAGHAPTAG
ncbi:hypothetical protein [Hypericibacter terrae]|jgi:hypothetical protein|nr:hypothetical protein [Hypericibacter terrae]